MIYCESSFEIDGWTLWMADAKQELKILQTRVVQTMKLCGQMFGTRWAGSQPITCIRLI